MNSATDIRELNEIVNKESLFIEVIQRELSKTIVGQKNMVDKMLLALLSQGHILLEGLPGLAKTLTIKSLAETIACDFNRIQFTPDLLPSDILGTMIYNQKEGEFKIKKGPIFSNFILADEINRAPAKVQSALLEAMQEKQVTIGDTTYKHEEPFLVMATQNPIEQEGTYPLPEAQLDRFMFNINLDYPSYEDELEIVRSTTGNKITALNKILQSQEIVYFQQLVRRVPVAENVLEYAVKLVSKTRPNTPHAGSMANEYLAFGAGPRAGQFLLLGAKCNALVKGKFSPDIEDVKAVAMNVLRHRLIRNFKAEAEGISSEKIIESFL